LYLYSFLLHSAMFVFGSKSGTVNCASVIAELCNTEFLNLELNLLGEHCCVYGSNRQTVQFVTVIELYCLTICIFVCGV